jgi:hypothetical protein
MVILEIENQKAQRHASPRAAGEHLAAWIRDNGFTPFCATFENGAELEWTDPDLFLEPTDLYLFGQWGIPPEFVRHVYINWQWYDWHLKPHNRN